VLIAAVHADRRHAIRRALIAEPALYLVGEALNLAELLAKVQARQPSVLVVGNDLLLDRASFTYRQTVENVGRTLLLTEALSAELPRSPLRDHLWGCLSYCRVDQDLVKAVLAIAGGEMWFSRGQLAGMLRERAEHTAPILPGPIILHGLTCRETEVAQLIARGKTNKEIGQAMDISDLTVKSHVQNIFKKCGLRRRGELPRQLTASV
jgi:DNA-binding NarL/FixJ family response regulator